MLLFDIGANRGDATVAGLEKGYKVVAVEAAPKIYKELVKNFIYNPNVIPIKFAVADMDYETIEFYEAEEDGLSTLNKEWLTNEVMPYAGKAFHTVKATTITVDTLAQIYGEPDLIKIDVEGAEWVVLKGISKPYSLTFEWTDITLDQHEKQLMYLKSLGYTEFGPQFIEHHLQQPKEWYKIGAWTLRQYIQHNAHNWVDGGWKESGLRPTSDVGMCWVR
jgi:FkbM family methyltransferase